MKTSFGIIVRGHHTETNGIGARAVRRVKEGTSVVLVQSGLDGGPMQWNAIAICATRIYWLMGKLFRAQIRRTFRRTNHTIRSNS